MPAIFFSNERDVVSMSDCNFTVVKWIVVFILYEKGNAMWGVLRNECASLWISRFSCWICKYISTGNFIFVSSICIGGSFDSQKNFFGKGYEPGNMDDSRAAFVSGSEYVYFTAYIFRSCSRNSVAEVCI